MADDLLADASQRLLALADQLDAAPMQVVAGVAEVVQTCFGPNGVDPDRLATQVTCLRDGAQTASAEQSRAVALLLTPVASFAPEDMDEALAVLWNSPAAPTD
ncbi:MAG: hypothetical protein ABI451_02690 [Dokdonella sp.]